MRGPSKGKKKKDRRNLTKDTRSRPEVAAISELESKLTELRSQLGANEQEWKDAISELN